MSATTWSPDTCECVIDVDGNWEMPVSVKSIKKCKSHELVSDGLPHLNAVWKGENQVKNYVLSIIQDRIPGFEISSYGWLFDAERKLQVSFKAQIPSVAIKNMIQADCNAKFGADKVKIN